MQVGNMSKNGFSDDDVVCRLDGESVNTLFEVVQVVVCGSDLECLELFILRLMRMILRGRCSFMGRFLVGGLRLGVGL
jgi:hypothetical protein